MNDRRNSNKNLEKTMLEKREAQRREFPRLNMNFGVNYNLIKHSDCYNFSEAKNIGKGGLLFSTNKQLKHGKKLVLKIKMPYMPQEIAIIGEVIESEEVGKKANYQTRIKFIAANPSDIEFLESLNSFIETHKNVIIK